MAEKLTLKECRRNGGAVDGDEGAILEAARIVDTPCRELLPDARFALNEDSGVARRDALDNFVDSLHAPTRSDDPARRNRCPIEDLA